MASLTKIMIPVAILGIVGGVWYWSPTESEEQIIYRTTSIIKGAYSNTVGATGTLEPSEIVDVGAQVTGEIEEFGIDLQGRRVDYGSEVKAGQLLARIDDTLVELDIKRQEASVVQAEAQITSAAANTAQSKASVTQAQANHDKAQRDLERAKRLGVGEALSQMSYDDYVTAAETAAASLEAAEAQLSVSRASEEQYAASLLSAKVQLEIELRNRDYTKITTPVDGTVIVRVVNVGQTVVSSMSATTLFLVARDLRHMQIWTSVNEVDIAKVQQGQRVEYVVDGIPDQVFTGVVNKIRPNATMSSNVVTYVVEVDIENPDRTLLPYMSAQASFIVKEAQDVLTVSTEALDFEPEARFLPGYNPEDDKNARLAGGPTGNRPEGGPEGGPGMGEGPGGPGQGGPGGPGGSGGGPSAGGGQAAQAPVVDRAAITKAKDRANKPQLIWMKGEDDTVKSIPVEVVDSNGSEAWIRPLGPNQLQDGDEVITSITVIAPQSSSGEQKGFMDMKRPERREKTKG